MLRLTTLGAIDLRDRLGKPVREVLAQPKRLALLVYLAVEGRGGPVERDRVLEHFWPAADADRARNALSQALHHLRRSLGPGVIASRGAQSLLVDAERLWCDAAVFTAALDRGETDLALDLYRGEFCPVLRVADAPPADAWFDDRRRRLRIGAVTAARMQAGRLLQGGDAEGAARAARRGLALQPEDDADVRALRAIADGAVPGGAAAHVAAPAAGAASRQVRAVAAVMVPLAILGLAVLAWRWGGGRRTALDRDLVAVAPFRVAASDSALAFLGDGMVDLLARRLSGAGRVRASDPQSVFASWRPNAAGGDDGAGPGAALARRLGAGWLVTGAVLGSSRRMVLAVSLTNLTTGDTREAETTGPLDSLAVLVDGVALQLLPVISDEPAPRTTQLARTPMPALRAYLDGRAAFRGGRFDEAVERLREAVALDTTFAVGALELAYVAGFTSEGNAPWLPRAVALSDRLSPGDRAILAALAGPRYPARSPVAEALDAWERATRAAPHSPEAWYDYGDYLFHAGEALARDTGFARAEAALRRAADLDSTDARALVHLAQIAARRGDVAAARRLADLVFARDSTTEQAGFLRWRVAVAAGDTVTVRQIEEALDTLPLGTVRRLVDWSQADGVRPGLALRAVEVFRRRAFSPGDRQLGLRQLITAASNAGRMDLRWTGLREYAPQVSPTTVAVEAYAWHDGSRTTGAIGERSRDPAARALFHLRDCENGASGACDRLRVAAAALPPGWESRDRPLALLVAAALRLPQAESLASGVDAGRAQALAFGELPILAWVEGRAWAMLDQPVRARAALQRRPYATMEANNFLAASLRLEGRLAVQLGDTAGAISAFRHYLALRSDPDAGVQPVVDSVRRELERLARP